MIIQDYNADGIPDIAFLSGGEGDAGVLVGKGNGTFRPVVFFGAGVSPLLIGAGTLASGGKPDLVLVSNEFLAAQPVSYSVLRNVSK